MKEGKIVGKIVDEIDAATTADVNVLTIGSDRDIDPPEVVIDWSSNRLPGYAGHSPFGGYVYDDNGDKIGVEYHIYSEMVVECIIRSYGEARRDDLVTTVQSPFVKYQRKASKFDPDTAQWDVGGAGTRQNPVFEPDYFESSAFLEFVYLKRIEVTGDNDMDVIEKIEDSVEVDESIDDTSITVN